LGKFKEKLNKSVLVVKWKVNQQFRINSSQNNEQKIMGEINSLKNTLTNETYEQYKSANLIEDCLIEICAKIDQRQQDLIEQKKETQQIRAEEPPNFSDFTNDLDGASELSEPINSNLICPKCKRAVPLRFCPDCGEEAVPSDK